MDGRAAKLNEFKNGKNFKILSNIESWNSWQMKSNHGRKVGAAGMMKRVTGNCNTRVSHYRPKLKKKLLSNFAT